MTVVQALQEEHVRSTSMIAYPILVVKVASVWMECTASSVNVHLALEDHYVVNQVRTTRILFVNSTIYRDIHMHVHVH